MSRQQKQAERLADRLKVLVYARTGLKGSTLRCPREKSEMTPCVARDGALAAVLDSGVTPICVGCEAAIEPLVRAEKARM